MKNPPENVDKIKAYLRRQGNPYASLQIYDDMEGPEIRVTARLLGNPYAALASPEELEGSPAFEVTLNSEPLPVGLGTLSKAAFQKYCRGIFSQYIPSLENGQLRPHHRDFILRNESRSPEMRYKLAAQLAKYDLSKLPGVSTQFNRERDTLTEKKLRQVEIDALGE